MSLSSLRRRPPQLGSLTLKTLSAAVLTAVLMSAANGAGLGRLTVLSSLGQPLNAEIELTSVGRDEAGNLSAKLASAEAFRQANIEFNPALYSLRFAIEQRGTRQVIRVTSAQPINEPFVDMLLELGGANGRLVREYTFLLDPADLRSAQTATPAITAAPPQRITRLTTEAVTVAPKAAADQSEPATPTPRRAAKSRTADVVDNGANSPKAYTVKRGDSLARIANQVRSGGVSLDQMLVAIYRANPDAFVGENMNRLRAGQILSIPGADVAGGIANSEARGVVIAQAADFSNYRSKLAGQVSASAPQKPAETSQSATGSISTKVEEQKNAANESKDKLKLSKSGVEPVGNVAAKAATGPSAEEQIAKDKAINEANSRVRELEKNVADLQKILELKNKNLAEQQKKAEAMPKLAAAGEATTPNDKTAAATVTPKTVTPAVPNVTVNTSTDKAAGTAVNPASNSAVSVASKTASNAASSTAANTVSTPPIDATKDDKAVQKNAVASATAASTALAPSTPSAEDKTPKVARPTAPQAESSFMDDLMGNAFVLPGLGLVLVALGALGIVGSRRKKKNQQFEDSILTDSNLKANSLFGSTGGQSVDTNNSVFNSNFSPTASHLDANEVDPVAEADVYIAYGRDAQAEEILKEALKTQPERHAVRTKLLEIYATRKDARSFDLMASELYGMTKGEGEDWAHAASMGAALDPNNPLYAGAKVLPAAGMAAAGGAAGLAAASLDLESLLATTQHHDLQSNIDTIAPAFEYAALSETSAATLPAIGSNDLTKPGVDYNAAAATATNAPLSTIDDGLDFDLAGLTIPEDKPATSSQVATKSTEVDPDLNSLNFDMPVTMASPASSLIYEEVKKAVDTEHQAVPSALHMPVDTTAMLPLELDSKGLALPAGSEPSLLASSPAFASKADPLEFDLSGISLDLSPANSVSVDPIQHAVHDRSLEQQLQHESLDTLVLEDDPSSSDPEMTTKLDLAMAYEEIGDKDGARELLDEVINGGSSEQVTRAKAMLSALG